MELSKNYITSLEDRIEELLRVVEELEMNQER